MPVEERRITRKIKGTPFGRAATEAFFAVAFTFFPIVLLSIPFAESAGVLSWESFSKAFVAYWEEGQLALPILGVCGTVAAMAALNGQKLPQALNTVAWLVSVALFLACGYALAESNGFAEPLNSGVLKAGVLAYVIVLTLRVTVSIFAQRGIDQPNAEERADKLVQELHPEPGNGAQQ